VRRFLSNYFDLLFYLQSKVYLLQFIMTFSETVYESNDLKIHYKVTLFIQMLPFIMYTLQY